MIFFFNKKTKIFSIILLFLLIFSIFNKPIKNTWLLITKPIYENFNKQGNFLYDSSKYFRNINEITEDNKKLKEEILKLHSKDSEYKLIKEENENIKQDMNLSIHERLKLISYLLSFSLLIIMNQRLVLFFAKMFFLKQGFSPSAS